MDIKDKILESALGLFNNNGSEKISTNHIATDCQISPGTLYYYFKNKNEIIRELFILMEKEYNEKYYKKINFTSDIKISDFLFSDEEILVKYSFFMEETNILRKNDSIFAETFDNFFKKKEGHIYMFLKLLQNQEYLQKNLKEEVLRKTSNIICFESIYGFFLDLSKGEALEYKQLRKIIPLYGILTNLGKEKLKISNL